MLIDKLKKEQALTKEEWVELIEGRNAELAEYLFALAREERHHYYDHDVYVRGLIEFTNYCKNDCLYCGIRKSNSNAKRYRLSERTFSPAARPVMSLVSAPLSCRAVRMDFTQMRSWYTSFHGSRNYTLTAH